MPSSEEAIAEPKVVEVVGSFNIGGAEKYVVTLSRLLKGQGCRVWICVLSDRRGTLAAVAERSGIECILLSAGSRRYYLACIRKLLPALKRLGINVVHSHGFQASVVGCVAAKLAGVRVIVTTEHGADLWKRSKHIVVQKLLTRVTDMRICNSEYTRQRRLSSRESPPEKLTVIWNGVERSFADSARDGRKVRQSLGIGVEEKVVGTVCRLTEANGIEYLVLATERIGARKCRVLIVGDGPRRGDLEEQVSQLGLKESVVFAGEQADVAPFLRAMDIFVMPSVDEAFGLAAVEAMACGLPVIASAVGGLPEIVRQDETGLLVKPRDVVGLSEAIIKLLDDENRRKNMGRRGRDAFLNFFTAERNAALVRQCYEKVLREKRFC